MRTLRLTLLVFILLFPALALRAFQDNPTHRLEITAVDSSQMPAVTVNANVYDALGQPVLGLTEENFSLTGDLAESATIVDVQNITDDALPFATVLIIDVSSSMAGAPIENARRAAQAFVDAVGPNDPVAIMTFGSSVRLRQDYTTDKAALSAVINSLIDGGETALYQGAYDAIQLASNSPTPRRAVILLSDGAEYGGESNVARSAAAAEALALGVPVYTIGLGYGIDRTYLQQLSASTSSQFYESPTPEELTELYTALAAKLRSQYIITLDVPLPLDGTQYTLGLNVTTPEGSANATAVLRAPIPVPILRLPDLSEPLTEQTEIRAELLADDAVETVIFQIGDGETVETAAASPAISIDPVGFLPGTYLLTVSATDEDGDTGSAVAEFTIAALPSQIALTPDLATLGNITEPQTITVGVTGQTVPTEITVSFDGGEPTDITAAGTFTLDPMAFAPGEHSVTVAVTNEGGITTEQTAAFSVGNVPPVITIDGLEAGQTIDAPITFTVGVQAQGEVSPVVTVNNVALEADADGAYSIDPMNFAPRNYTLSVTASDALESVATVNFTVAALPPVITIAGLEAGETLYGDRQITPEFTSQSEVTSLTVTVDDAEVAQLTEPPFSFTLRVLDFVPGEHTLQLTAENADGQRGTLEIPFSIGVEPAATATQQAFASATQIAVVTQRAAATEIAVQATQVAVITATQQAVASATQAAQDAIIAQGTQDAQSTQAVQASATQMAVDAQATQVSIEASGTAASLATSAAEQSAQEQAATATADALAAEEQNAAATANASATQVAEATRAAQQAAQDVAATATAQAVEATSAAQQAALDQAATATADALATATQAAEATSAAQQAALDQAATATDAAVATATQAAEATSAAQQAALDQAATATDAAVATATQAAEATRAAQQAALEQAATATAQAQATEEAEATQTAQAQSLAEASATQAAQTRLDNRATAQAQAQAALQAATRDALATSNAESRLAAQATQDARATRNADATATQDARATATVNAQATEAALQATQDSIDATATDAAREAIATQSAQETLTALEATATGLIIEATATRNALETQTANNATATRAILNETATEAAALEQATQAAVDERATQNADATAERVAQVTATAEQIALAAQATRDQATLNAGATATSIAQATQDTRLTAVGPTSTQAESGAQDALTPTPQPTLTEVQTGEAAAASNLAPIAIIVIVIIIIIVVLVLIMRGRGSPGMRN